MSTLLPHGEGGTASQAAELSPNAFPLQRVRCHPEGELQGDRPREREGERETDVQSKGIIH